MLRVDDTNMKDVYYSAEEYSQNLLFMLESNIKEDRTDLDLLFGCLLDWGLPLSLPYHSEKIEECTVHNYNDGDLIACFDENIPEDVITVIARMQPLRVVFRDSSFADSSSKMNVEEIFKLMTPDTAVKSDLREESYEATIQASEIPGGGCKSCRRCFCRSAVYDTFLQNGRGEMEQQVLFEEEKDICWGNQRIVSKLQDAAILERIRNIQREHQIPLSEKLEGTYNLTIEMETGVGKTYTYIKTMYALE